MLDRAHRLIRSDDFRRVMRRGTKSTSSFVAVYSAPNERGLCRFGLVTAKTVGNAPQRNKFRRQLRAIAHEVSDNLSSDFVIRVLPGAIGCSWEDLRADTLARIQEAVRRDG